MNFLKHVDRISMEVWSHSLGLDRPMGWGRMHDEAVPIAFRLPKRIDVPLLL